jgi:holo-[acyl-carrier protein] synthase
MGSAKFQLTVSDGEATLATCSEAGGKTMDDTDRWRDMASAPRDGSRILVTIRPSEQGPAEVDLAYWSHGDQFGAEGWRASDSSPGHIIEYAEPELKCWMPMPSANLNRTSMPSPWEGDDDQELHGSGI